MVKKNDMTKYESQSRNRINYLISEYCGGSQQQFADKTKINKASISQYVNGRNVPSNITAGKIADTFNINPAWLMGFDVPMERDAAPASPEPVALSAHEGEIITAYRNASDDTQLGVCAVLGVKRGSEQRTEEITA